MIISVEEGTKLATDLVSDLCQSAQNNNHAELMRHLFADIIEWKWPDGAEGKGSPDVMMNVLKTGWGMMSSYATHTKPFVVVDTENGRIVVTFTMIANVNARREGLSNIVMNPVTYILMVNKNKKITRWSAIWDNNNEDVLKAVAKLGVDMPKAENKPMLITRAEGEAFATKYLQALSDGFLDNSLAEKCRDFVADNVSWDWSDGAKGTGTSQQMFDILSNGWEPMMASWIHVDPITVVDTTNGVVAISFRVVSNITGGLKDENNSMEIPQVFVFHLDGNHKAYKVDVCWDNNDATLQSTVSKIKTKLELAQSTSGKVLNVGSEMEGIMTGQ